MVQLLAACLGPPCGQASWQPSLTPAAGTPAAAAAAAVDIATTALAAALAYPDPATACASTAGSVAPLQGPPANRQRGQPPFRPHNHQLQPLQPQQVALIMELCEGGSLGGRIHNPAKRRLEYGEVLQVRRGYGTNTACGHGVVAGTTQVG